MSVSALTWAFAQQVQPPPHKSVLVALAWHADKDTDLAFPSVAVLQNDTGLERRTIFYALADLKKHGLIQATGKFEGKKQQIPVYQCKTCTGAPDARVHSMHSTGAPDAPVPVHSVHPEPKRGTYKEPKPPLPPFPPELDHEDFKVAWSDYLNYRKESHLKTLVPRTVRARFKEFAKWGRPVSIKAIQETICNSWTGIFFPKNNGEPEPENHRRHL